MNIFSKGNRCLVILTIVFSLLANAALVLTSKQYEWFFDIVAGGGDLSEFMRLACFSILYIFLVITLFYIYLVCSKKLMMKILVQVRKNIFNGIISKDMKSFYKQNTSSYLSVLTNDISLLEENRLKPILGILENIGIFVTTVILLLSYSPLITFAIFTASVLAFLIPVILGRLLSKRQQRLSKELASFSNQVKNILSGFDVIHSFNMVTHIKINFASYNKQLSERKYETDQCKVINDTIAQALGITIQVGTSCLCAYLVISGQLSIGALAAVIQLCSRFVTPLTSIMNQLSLIKSMNPILKKFDELSAEPTANVGRLPHFTSSIRISQLSFSYDTCPVLDHIDLEIYPTRKYAIMGESGCGKSTLIKLLLGYYSNFQGTIQYDGETILNLDLSRLNEMASIIQQNVYMFDETIKYNICLQKEYSSASFDQAINRSGVCNILNGGLSLESQAGENGCNLSGGQRQRIAIARALIRNTPILILDEGTSAVDMQSAYEIEHHLLEIKELTLLSILHKTSEQLLKRYDEIIFMQKGRVVEKGTFHELISSKGAFYSFYTIPESIGNAI